MLQFTHLTVGTRDGVHAGEEREVEDGVAVMHELYYDGSARGS